jgi:predicted small lipoprotein YifL
LNKDMPMRVFAVLLTVLTLAACGLRTGPAGQPSASNVNPESGSRGGSGSR